MSGEFDAEAWLEAMAELIELPIRPEWRPTIVANLVATAAQAALVLEFPLDDHVEPAPVFEA